MEYLLKEIDVFVKIIELGSFKAAAEDLNLTQSAMTQRLKKLEDALGVRLIERTTRSVSPTAIGARFLPMAKRMILQFEQSMSDLDDLIKVKKGQVTIASLISVATYVLPAALRDFSTAHPDVGVRVLDDAEQEIAGYVQRGEAEFGIDMQTPSKTDDLTRTPLMRDRYVLACHAGHPLASQRAVSWRALAGMPLVTLGSRSGTSRLFLSRIEGAANSSAWRYEVQHLSTLIGFVEAGLGVGIVPAMAIEGRSGASLVQRRLIEPDLRRTIVLIQRRGMELSPAAQVLKASLLSAFKRMEPKR